MERTEERKLPELSVGSDLILRNAMVNYSAHMCSQTYLNRPYLAFEFREDAGRRAAETIDALCKSGKIGEDESRDMHEMAGAIIKKMTMDYMHAGRWIEGTRWFWCYTPADEADVLKDVRYIEGNATDDYPAPRQLRRAYDAFTENMRKRDSVISALYKELEVEPKMEVSEILKKEIKTDNIRAAMRSAYSSRDEYMEDARKFSDANIKLLFIRNTLSESGIKEAFERDRYTTKDAHFKRNIRRFAKDEPVIDSIAISHTRKIDEPVLSTIADDVWRI